jgi:hypothetical protein
MHHEGRRAVWRSIRLAPIICVLCALPANSSPAVAATSLAITMTVAGQPLPAAALDGTWSQSRCDVTLSLHGSTPAASSTHLVATATSPFHVVKPGSTLVTIHDDYSAFGHVGLADNAFKHKLEYRQPGSKWVELGNFSDPVAVSNDPLLTASMVFDRDGHHATRRPVKVQVRWTLDTYLVDLVNVSATFKVEPFPDDAVGCAGS